MLSVSTAFADMSALCGSDCQGIIQNSAWRMRSGRFLIYKEEEMISCLLTSP
jgi:hypothetical protein